MDKSERQQLAREIAADQHDQVWPQRTSYGQLPRESFIAGWDAAMQSVSQETEPHCATCRCEGRSYAEDAL